MPELTATTNTPSNFILFVKSDLDEEVLSDTLVMNYSWLENSLARKNSYVGIVLPRIKKKID